MAIFNPTPNPTNDPSYLGLSKDPEKVKPNTALGDLFGNIATTGDIAIKVGDKAIQQGIRDELNTNIDTIRNEHGADLKPSEIPAIAGTGARGARYQASSDAGVTPEDLGHSPAVPDGITNSIAGLNRMKQAHKSGGLSESHFDASLESEVIRMRAKYPAYRDEIDTMVSQITGVVPANALRRSILSDMNSLAAASTSAANRVETQYMGQREFLNQLKPGMTLQDYAADKSRWDAAVGDLKATDQRFSSRNLLLDNSTKEASSKSADAEQLFTDRAANKVQTIVKGSLAQLEGRLQGVIKAGVNANPAEVQQLQLQAQEIERQIKGQLLDIANERRMTSDNKVAPSYAMHVGIDKINNIIDKQVQPIRLMAEALSNKNGDGIANATANIIKHRGEQDQLAIENHPVMGSDVRLFKAFRGAIGDQATGVLVQSSTVLPDAIKAMHDRALMVTRGDGKPGDTDPVPTMPEILKSFQGNRPEKSPAGKTIRLTLNNWMELAKHENPEVAARAVESLYKDPSLLASFPSDQDRAQVYSMLGSPQFTAKMQELRDKGKPEAWNAYTNWMETNFPSVANIAIDRMQKEVVEFNRAQWSFDPKSMHFTASMKPEFRGTNPLGDPASGAATRLNSYIDQVKPILEQKYGEQAPVQLLQMLGKQGLNAKAPQSGSFLENLSKPLQPNAFLENLGKTMKDSIQNWMSPEGVGPKKNIFDAPVIPSPAPAPAKPAKSGNLSLQEQTTTDVASNFVGLDERNNRTVLASFIKKATGKSVDPAVQPWCADFANAVLAETGETGTGSSAARSFLAYGKAVNKGQEGDIVVLSRGDRNGPYGHVGFVAGHVQHDGQEYVQVLGGNQGSSGSVSVQEYPVSRVLGYRRVSSADMQKYSEADGNPPNPAG
jgi:uncharacterized protein (TIGR02594 family)